MTKRKLPSGVQERSGKYIVTVMVAGTRMTSPAFKSLEDHLLIKARLQKALKKANGDKQLAKQIYENEDVYQTTSADLLPYASPAVRKAEWTLREAYDATILFWKRKDAHKSNAVKAGVVLRYFKPNTKLSLIDNDKIEEYVDYLKAQGRSNSTIRKNLAALSKMLHVAHKKNHLMMLPVIERPKEDEAEIRWIGQHDPVEETKIINLFYKWGKHDHIDVFVTLLDSGMRQAELFGLKVSNINLSYVDPSTGQSFAAIVLRAKQTKTKAARAVPVTKRVRAILQRRMKGKSRNDLLFPYDSQWLRNQWDRIRVSLKKTKDDCYTPHITRHTFATRLIQRGVDTTVLKELGGWKNMNMVMRYAHLAPSNLLTAVEVLDNINSGTKAIKQVSMVNAVSAVTGVRERKMV